MPETSGKSESAILPVELPPLPAVAIRALQIASNGDGRLRELHDIVCTDQVFVGELLKLANAPLYGISSEIKSTLQASILLGYERLKGLILTIGIRMYLSNVLEISVLRACWRHSLACAFVAEDLSVASYAARSRTRAYLDKDAAFTAAILHDLGRLALAKLRPRQYADFLKSTETQPCNVLARERELFGIDHCEAGRLLVQGWGLPAEFARIASRHHDAAQSQSLDALAAVHFSCQMADALGFQVAYSGDSRTYEELLGTLPECERRHFGSSPKEYIFRIASKINAIECV
jgi:HD-like signal output (HDOD) protein